MKLPPTIDPRAASTAAIALIAGSNSAAVLS